MSSVALLGRALGRTGLQCLRVDTVVAIRGVTKRYGDLVALDGVDLDIRRGRDLRRCSARTARARRRSSRSSRGSCAPTPGDVARARARRRARLPRRRAARSGSCRRRSTSTRSSPSRRRSASRRATSACGSPRSGSSRSSSALDLLAKRTTNSRGALRRDEAAAPHREGARARAAGAVPRRADGGRRRGAAPGAVDATCGTLRERGTTIVLTTHYLEEAEELADRVGVIDRGRLLVVEDKEALLSRHGAKALRLALARPHRGAARGARGAGRPARGGRDGRRRSRRRRATRSARSSRRSRPRGLAVRDVETRRTTLEDVFVRLVARDRGGGAGVIVARAADALREGGPPVPARARADAALAR